MIQQTREHIKNAIMDLVSELCYYRRKEDEDLSIKDFNNAIKNNIITLDEMVNFFRDDLSNVVKSIKNG